jgi:hypothetical protein
VCTTSVVVNLSTKGDKSDNMNGGISVTGIALAQWPSDIPK